MSGEANSLYSPEMLEKAEYYLANYKKIGREVPSIKSLARYLKVARQTPYNWSKDEDKKAFLGILEQIEAEQEEVLIDKGLNGDFNSNIVKLMLGKHGYHDKQDVAATGFNVTIGNKDAGNL